MVYVCTVARQWLRNGCWRLSGRVLILLRMHLYHNGLSNGRSRTFTNAEPNNANYDFDSWCSGSLCLRICVELR